MRVKALLVLLAVLVSACASYAPSRSKDTTEGFFDEGEADYRPSPRAAPAPSYTSDAPSTDRSDDELYSVQSVQSSPTGGVFEGLFNRGEPAREAAPPPGPPPPPAPKPPPQNDETSRKAAESSEGAKPGKRMVIYTGSLTVLVTNINESLDKLAARVESAGGYVQSRTGNTSSNNGVMTVRVPADQFHTLVKELAGYGQLINEQITANDVTKQMFDIELRLETAEKSRARLVDLLKTATKMEEILQIESEIRRLTQEIEGMKGELRFLKDQVAFSTLTITFYSNAPPPTPGPHRTRSRFEWINQVGIEQVLGGF